MSSTMWEESSVMQCGNAVVDIDLSFIIYWNKVFHLCIVGLAVGKERIHCKDSFLMFFFTAG